MWRWMSIVSIAAACGEGASSIPFEPCVGGDPVDVIGPVAAETWGQRVLLVDEHGYALFWAHQVAGEGGIWAARPGGEAVQVADNTVSQSLAVVPVPAGFLVCWSASSQLIGQPRAGECFTVNAAFQRVGPTTRPSFGAIHAMGEAGGVTAAVADDDVTMEAVLFSVDDAGHPTSTPVAWPCVGARATAWAPAGVACLIASDPACGTQFDEPPGCMNDLHVYDARGELQLLVPGVAPYGTYSEWTDVALAARPDGYITSWIDGNGWHAQPIELAGVLGTRTDINLPTDGEVHRTSSLHALQTGYVAIWTEKEQYYELPRLLRIAPDGTPGTLEWAAEPTGDFTRQFAHSAIAAGSGGGLALVWEAVGGNEASDYVAALRFRTLGCADP